MGRAVAAMTLALVLAPIVNVRGDGPLHELLAELDQKIAKSTITDPTLHIRRGSLLLQDGQRERATADFVVATSNLGVDPKTTLSLAHFAYRLERFDTALELVSRYPSSAPHEASARVLRARTLRALKQILAAIAEFDRAIAATREPQLSLYLERHRLYLQAPPETRAQAIVGLRQGIKTLGPREPLILAAYLVERDRGEWRRALGWVNQLGEKRSQDPIWVTRRAEALAGLGQRQAATRLLEDALRQLSTERESPRIRRIRARLAMQLEAIRNP